MSPFSSIVRSDETKVWTPATTVDVDRAKRRLIVRASDMGPDADAAYRDSGGAPIERLTAKGSDDERDRHGTTFLPMGAELGPFRANPIIKYQHGYGQLWDIALGAATAVEKREDGVFFEIRLGNTIEGLQGQVRDLVYSLSAMYEEGLMRAFSIGAEALEYVFPDGKEETRVRGSRHPYLEPGTVIRQWELWELSAVDIGSNVNALTVGERAALRGLAEHYAPRLEREEPGMPLTARLREIARGEETGDAEIADDPTALSPGFGRFFAARERGDESARKGFSQYFQRGSDT